MIDVVVLGCSPIRMGEGAAAPFIGVHILGEIRLAGGFDTVGTLKDGYVRNVPLPRVPQRQSASHLETEPVTMNPIHTGYSPVPSWIPTLPKLGSILGFSQILL